MISIPKKLGVCPIVEAIFEVRFEPSVASNAVFPILYGAFRNDFPNIEQIIPIAQMPMTVVENDQNLRFQPHYRMRHQEHNNILVQIGPRVLTVNMLQPYDGWVVLFEYIKRYFQLDFKRLNSFHSGYSTRSGMEAQPSRTALGFHLARIPYWLIPPGGCD